MNWTTPADLRAQVERLWTRGELLRALVAPGEPRPLRLSLKTPASSDLTERFEAVRKWAADLAAMPHLRIEWREIQHRVQGRQRLPEQVWLDDTTAALALIAKRRDAQTWLSLWQGAAAELPALSPWLLRKPHAALELAERWPQLVAVVQWLIAHPRPAVYLRQVDVAGVDSKFVEAHRGVLTEWLDLALPASAIDPSATGIAQFARRYGFRDKPQRIRFRVLDAGLQLLPGQTGSPDITLDAGSFAALNLDLNAVFITENETNFLAFPPHTGAIVIFGAGYGWDALARATWLARCAIHYWGDIDTHGFAILDQLRAHFPHARSLLMDRATLLAHAPHWGSEPEPVHHALQRLDADEQALFQDLQQHRIRERLRMEQERVAYSHLLQALAQITHK
ncbi:MAG: hypothetical protein KF778_18895 [Rhodocyclaceae bacterium]|nr:hypothetical protein [Rhodocyclaceae bacterium]